MIPHPISKSPPKGLSIPWVLRLAHHRTSRSLSNPLPLFIGEPELTGPALASTNEQVPFALGTNVVSSCGVHPSCPPLWLWPQCPISSIYTPPSLSPQGLCICCVLWPESFLPSLHQVNSFKIQLQHHFSKEACPGPGPFPPI